MDVVFEALFYFAVGLIAITVTIFVLAVSLLGRAIKLSVQEQTIAEERSKKDTDDEIQELQEELEKAKAECQLSPEVLIRKLQKLESKQRRHKQKLFWIKLKPKLLTTIGGVFIPGIFFILSIIFSLIARHELSQSISAATSTYLFLTILFMVIGILYICLILRVIQGVAITTEETAFTIQKEVFKEALLEIDEAKKPTLFLEFSDSKPPFHVVADSEFTIDFSVGLNKGQVAKNSVIAFWTPAAFKFPEGTKKLPTRYKKYAEHTSCRLDVGELRFPFDTLLSIKLTTPSEPGKYMCVYRLYCEGFNSEYKEFDIIVEESDEPPDELPF